jgi:hypothetical protein
MMLLKVLHRIFPKLHQWQAVRNTIFFAGYLKGKAFFLQRYECKCGQWKHDTATNKNVA